MEEAHAQAQHKADDRADDQRAHDLAQRDECHVDYGHGRAADHGLRHADGDGIGHQAQRIVHGHHGQQHFAHRALGLVLTDDHQCRGGGRGGGDRAQRDAHGQVKAGYAAQGQDDQHDVHDQHRAQPLADGDDHGLCADAL